MTRRLPSNRIPEISRRNFLRLGAGAAVATALGGCAPSPPGPQGPPGGPAPKRPNVLLLSVDTLRADHLGCYGYTRDTSPNIDTLAARACVYRDAQAPASWTLPSHASLLTGRHAFDLGIVSEQGRMPPDVVSIASVLQSAGYATAGFVDSAPSGFVGAERGFAQGFDTYQHAPFVDGLLYNYDMAATVDAVLRWLGTRDKSRPYFLFLHTKSAHDTPQPNRPGTAGWPYEKPEPHGSMFLTEAQKAIEWRPPFAEYFHTHNRYLEQGVTALNDYSKERIDALIGQYDGGIAYMDHHFGRLLEDLDSMGGADDTIVVVTSDHGEAFLEHRHFAHVEIYNQLTHVPLIVALPSGASASIDTPVALEDIAPSLLRLTGIEGELPMQTGLVLPDRQVAASGRRLFSYYRDDTSPFPQQYALREGGLRMVFQGTGPLKGQAELYDALNDPAELSPLDGREHERAAMLSALLEWVNTRAGAAERQIELTLEDQDHLRSLGYFD